MQRFLSFQKMMAAVSFMVYGLKELDGSISTKLKAIKSASLYRIKLKDMEQTYIMKCLSYI
jgi:hypothetical protein